MCHLMKFTYLGKALRAVAQDRETAGLMGINPNALIMLTIVISSALAGMAGAMLAPVSPFPIQTSLYGASKLAGEGLIQAYCEGFGFQGFIFRFVSILGERYTHGHVFDFYKQLRAEPERAARARQRQAAQVVSLRSGLHRRDPDRDRASPTAKVQRLQPRHRRILRGQRLDRLDHRHLGLSPRLDYTGGDRGWIGDSPFIFLDCAKDPRARLEAEADDPRGDRRARSTTCEANPWLLEARA